MSVLAAEKNKNQAVLKSLILLNAHIIPAPSEDTSTVTVIGDKPTTFSIIIFSVDKYLPATSLKLNAILNKRE